MGAGSTAAEVSESDLSQLHGMGPTAIAALRAALGERVCHSDAAGNAEWPS
jgi:hypothetical protein